MRSRTLSIGLLLASHLPLYAQSAAEWSRFRGPNGSGVSSASGLPSEIGPEQNLVWRRELGPGHSSPILDAERVYLTTLEGEELATICLDAASGAVIWRRVAPRARQETLDPRNHAAAPSPAVDDERVVVFFADFGLLAYDKRGQELWRHALGPFHNVYGMGASPILHAGRVYLACDQQLGSFLLALDAASGELVWRSERPWAKSSHCTPIIVASQAGGEELILPGSFYLDAYGLERGERRWWVRGLCFEMKSVPLVSQGLVYVNGYGSPMNQPGNQVEVPQFDAVLAERDADQDGGISPAEMPPGRAANWFDFVDLDADKRLDEPEWGYLRDALASQNGLLAIEPGGEGELPESRVRWAYRRSVPQLPSPLIEAGVLYMLADSGGLITTLDPKSGELRAHERLAGAVDNYYASPVAADGRIWLASENGTVLALPAGGSLEPTFVANMGERIYATPAFAEGRIYLRTEQALYCFGEKHE